MVTPSLNELGREHTQTKESKQLRSLPSYAPSAPSAASDASARSASVSLTVSSSQGTELNVCTHEYIYSTAACAHCKERRTWSGRIIRNHTEHGGVSTAGRKNIQIIRLGSHDFMTARARVDGMAVEEEGVIEVIIRRYTLLHVAWPSFKCKTGCSLFHQLEAVTVSMPRFHTISPCAIHSCE